MTINLGVNVILDGVEVKAPFGLSLLQACFLNKIDIPRFCYHENLKIAGNCRMCLLEVSNNRKLVASCATPLMQSFEIFTKTFRVKRARQSVLEFLLINHPLDCPICDQGGECDLQDITLMFGGDRGRFYETAKRAVVDKFVGPLVKTLMNRCIHCTRCVRFFEEVETGLVLGTLGRGSLTEIGSYLPVLLLNELSGNVIDLCPVGALTSKPFAFKARSWELQNKLAFDIFDVLQPKIRFDVLNNNIIRVLPLTESNFVGWISNKTRFGYEAINTSRVDSCMWVFNVVICDELFTSTCQILWVDAFKLIVWWVFNGLFVNLNAILGSLLDFSSMYSIKNFFGHIGLSNLTLGLSNLYAPKDYLTRWFFDFSDVLLFSFNGIFDMKDLYKIFLCGVNLRTESPVLFYKFRQLVKLRKLSVYDFGGDFGRYKGFTINIGVSNVHIIKFFEGRNSNIRSALKDFLFWNFWFVTNTEMWIKESFFALYGIVISFVNDLQDYIHYNSMLSYSNLLSDQIFSHNVLLGCIQRSIGFINFTVMGTSFSNSFFLDNSLLGRSSQRVVNFFFNCIESSYTLPSKAFNVIFTAWDVFNRSKNNGDFAGSLILPIFTVVEDFGCSFNLGGQNVKLNKIINNTSMEVRSISDILLAFLIFCRKQVFDYLPYVFGGFFTLLGDFNDSLKLLVSNKLILRSYWLFERGLSPLCLVYMWVKAYIPSVVGISLPNFYSNLKSGVSVFSKSLLQSSVAINRSFHSFY